MICLQNFIRPISPLGIVENHPALVYAILRFILSVLDICSRYPTERMKQLYDVNVHGVFFTAREAAKRMIPQGGGSIILISSMSANASRLLMLKESCEMLIELNPPCRSSTHRKYMNFTDSTSRCINRKNLSFKHLTTRRRRQSSTWRRAWLSNGQNRTCA